MKDRIDALREWARVRPCSFPDAAEFALASLQFGLRGLLGRFESRAGSFPFLGGYLRRSIVVRTLGLRVAVRPHTDDLHNSDRFHKPAVAAWFKPSKGDFVVDVGSHIGLYSLWAANLGAQVIAFEPNPKTFEALARNVKLNEITGFDARCMAISDQEGWSTLFAAGGWSSVDSLDPTWAARFGADVRSTTSVPTQTLDHALSDFKASSVDWLLIDAEGMELPVLRGASRTLRKTRRVIIEVEPESASEVVRLLREGEMSIVDQTASEGVNTYLLGIRKGRSGS